MSNQQGYFNNTVHSPNGINNMPITPNTSSNFQNVSNMKLINGNITNNNNNTNIANIHNNNQNISNLQSISTPQSSVTNTQSSAHNQNKNRGNRDDSTIVGLHYKIGKKIGEGSFGVLFEGVNMINGVPVAIKFEPRKTEAPQLKDEYRAYKILNGTPGVPQAYYFGQEGLHNILVIDLLGPSLEDLFEWCNRKFSVKTVVQVAVQMITLIEDLHAHDLIYRDIKPDNFLVGRLGSPDANKIHLIDFGMAKQYRDPKTKQHIPYREKKSLSGTARYMSINTHLGREQSRRDDMEALGHVFFYFLRGQLPWQGLKAPNNKQKYEKIGEKKRSTNVYDLAQGLPIQFGRYLEIVRNLAFDETPDYEGYRQLLLSILDDLSLQADGEYDWMKLNGGRGYDLSINKKPNLHGYGHPNPPNEKRRHRSKQHMALQQQQQAQQQQQQMHQLQQQQQAQAQAQAQAQQGQAGNENKLDPTSYEAYQQQTQQKYAQQQQKQQQRQQQHQQNTQQQGQRMNNNNVNNNKPYNYQEQPNTVNHNNGKNGTVQTNDNESEKGFFSKLGCC
ncbi:casein kinase I homolog 2 [Monosporozyma unispora]